jgi:hypothetical protein
MATVSVLLGRHCRMPGETVRTEPLTEVIRPPDPGGIETTM